MGDQKRTTRQWLADRPAAVALAALLAPALISMLALGAAGMLPDARAAARALPRLAQPAFDGAGQDVGAPPPPAREVVPAGRATIHVPILEYHYVRVNPNPRDRLGFNLSVTPQDFVAQMDWLDTHGYHPIDLTDLRAYFQANQPLPSRPVVLTFDDGYADFWSAAFPVLQAHEFRAVSYVVPGFLGRPNYMTPAQVRAIDAGGVEVGAHTLHHVDLTKAAPAELALELQGSRRALEELTGHQVLDFCYPSGKYDPRVVAAVQAAGFQSATTEVPGTGRSWADRLTWSRTRVNGGERLDQFANSLEQPEPSISASPPEPA